MRFGNRQLLPFQGLPMESAAFSDFQSAYEAVELPHSVQPPEQRHSNLCLIGWLHVLHPLLKEKVIALSPVFYAFLPRLPLLHILCQCLGSFLWMTYQEFGTRNAM